MPLIHPTDTVFYQIEKAIKSYRTMAQANLNQLNQKITINQILLLLQLHQKPETTQVELANLLFKDVASITRMIELLAKRGFITRTENKSDRRKKDLKLSKKGKEILELASPIIQKNREMALSGLSNNELEELDNYLRTIIQNTSK